MHNYLSRTDFSRDAHRRLNLRENHGVIVVLTETVGRKRSVSLVKGRAVFFACRQQLLDKLVLAHGVEKYIWVAVHPKHGKVNGVKARFTKNFHALVNSELRENGVCLC